MDSVIGTVGGKVLLTMNFNNYSLMLMYLSDSDHSQSAIDVFNMLEECLTIEGFQTLSLVVLTNNGSEFSNPGALEKSPFTGKTRTRVFYCNPYSSWQKGHVDNNISISERTCQRIDRILGYVANRCVLYYANIKKE